jgi:UDP-N-acetylmuramoyl-tripeptide--D-alanyl-D-alanine ligase
VTVAETALTLADVLDATGGALLAKAPPLAFSAVSIDSRSLGPGALFLAISGPRFDGHDFLAQAAERGALAAVVEREPAAATGLVLVRVADTTRALSDLARHVRQRAALPVVAITGSVGKTTTKDMTAALLATRGPVLKTEGNLNNQYGLPLTLLRLRSEHSAAVLELGMSAVGEIRALVALARPDVAVITRIAPVHLEFFASLDAIAEAKAEILEGLAPRGTAVLNGDDPRVARIGERFGGRVVWFGRGQGRQVTASDERRNGTGTELTLHVEGEAVPVRLPLVGPHFVENVLAAAAAAHVLGVAPAAMAAAAARLGAAPHRGEVLHLGEDVVLLDDCYNSSPAALEAAVTTLGILKGQRRVAVLGDMLELGPTGAFLHRDRGRSLRGRVDVVIGVGPLAKEIVIGAREAGIPGAALHHFADARAAAAATVEIVRPGDSVLVKASRGVALEAVVDALVARFGRGEA